MLSTAFFKSTITTKFLLFPPYLSKTFPTFAPKVYLTNYDMEQQQSSYKERERIDLRKPRRFKVTIFNEDFTTMEFVMKILTTVFFKSVIEAEALMMRIYTYARPIQNTKSHPYGTE